CQKTIVDFYLFIQLKQIMKNNLDEIIFIKINVFFIIIMYNFHVFYLYFFHLIKSLNCVNFVFHFMSSIKLTKYKFSLFLTIMNCNNDTCLLIKSFFENHNKLI